jgi:hypothetical protein
MTWLYRLGHWWLGLSGRERAHLILEVCGIIVVGVYTRVAALQWGAMNQANIQNASNFVASQRPYVSIGKRDGTIGELVYPFDSKGNASVSLYFYNGGNLPASRFNIQLFAVTGATTEQHMVRLKNKATGITEYMTAAMKEIARDSDNTESFPNWVSEADILSARAGSKPISLSGFFEYCDAFGEYFCRRFTVGYEAQTNSFNLNSTSECSYQYPRVTPFLPLEMEYLPPCPTPDEQKNDQAETEHYIEIGRPPPVPAWHAPTASTIPTRQ